MHLAIAPFPGVTFTGAELGFAGIFLAFPGFVGVFVALGTVARGEVTVGVGVWGLGVCCISD